MQHKSQMFLLLSLNLDVVTRIQCGWTEMCGHQTERSPYSSCTWANSTARPGDWLKAADGNSFHCKRRILQPHKNSRPAGQEQQSIKRNPGTEEERKGTSFVTKSFSIYCVLGACNPREQCKKGHCICHSGSKKSPHSKRSFSLHGAVSGWLGACWP